jgi:GNAT superfamily N-acetyltransferase
MTSIRLIRPEPQHISELARICFEAFAGIHDRHAFPRDIPNIELATQIIGLFVTRKDFYGVAAKVDGRLVGSNFLSCTDAVGGVGPITVDPAFDGRGGGRALMNDVLGYAKRNGMEQVRFLQDAFNTKSFSLYASPGFDVRTPVGLMDAEPAMFFCPLIRGNFYRAVLKAGHRLRKIMTCMALGPFEQPEEIWLPSIGY